MTHAETPFVSVIVPTRDRPAQLARCLDALARLEYPHERYEVIVVDDGSDPPVAAPALAGPSVVIVQESGAGPAHARNAGAARARGELLAFTDDDCRPDAGWLAAFARVADASGRLVLGGETRNGLAENPFAAATQLLREHLHGADPSGQPVCGFFPSNNLAVSAVAFHAAGGFDPTFRLAAGEDRDLCARLVEAGNALRYVPEAVVEHWHALSLRSFVRQHLNYGRGSRQFRRTARQRRGARVAGPAAGFYVDLLGLPFRRTRSPRAVVLSVLLACSQLATATGYLIEAARRVRA